MKNIYSLLLIVFLCSSCETEKKTNHRESPSNLPKKEAVVNPIKVTGASYNDSLMEKIVQEQLASLNSVPIDTFQELHSFESSKFPQQSLTFVSMDTVNKYLEHNNPVTKPQKQLLKIADYFANLSFSNKFNAYVFLDKKGEAHYSPALTLWTISKTTNERHHLPLAQHYLGGESYEKIISSEIISENAFRRKIIEYLGPRNAKGFMDEDSKQKITEELYLIQDDGKIELVE